MKIPRKTSRDTTFELINQAGAFLDFLPPSRARSMVGTKLDEAVFWLTQVEPDEPLSDEDRARPDEPLSDEDRARIDDPFGIKAGRDAMERDQAKKEGSL